MKWRQISEYLRKEGIRARQSSPKLLSSEGKDISISTDKELNESIMNFLVKNFDYPILSEEQKEKNDFNDFNSFYWVIDPLDGSMNYFRGIPISCISIGLWMGQKPVLGFVYDFNRDEMFFGSVESSEISDKIGCWMNEIEISTSSTKSKSQAILATGFPSLRDYDKKSLESFTMKVRNWKKVRLLGSAALSLAWVACGRMDAYIEEDIRIWDIAAGLALVKAAGGSIYFASNSEKINFVTAGTTNGNIPIEELT